MRKGCLSFIVVFPLVSVFAYSAEPETVNRLQSLSADKRMELLIEGAKKEREVVWYGNAALLIDYLLSEEAQRTIASLGRAPSRKGVRPSNPELRNLLGELKEERMAPLDPEMVGSRVDDAYKIIKDIFLAQRR